MYLNFLWDFAINKLAASVIVGKRLRSLIYRVNKLDIKTSSIRPGVFFYSNKVKIGENSFINKGCFFYNVDLVDIGNNVFVAPEVSFCTNTHELGNEIMRAGEMITKPIIIGDGSWIGTRATILPGVKVGKGCVVAAGAVVTKDCEPNGLYAGVPAKRIKDLPISIEKNETYAFK